MNPRYRSTCDKPDRRYGGRSLYRVPQEGMIKGVCAGIAHYFDIPVAVVRVLAVVALFFGMFFITLVVYLVLAAMLPEAPVGRFDHPAGQTASQLLHQLSDDMAQNEQQLRQMERYITSETFNVQSRFRQL